MPCSDSGFKEALSKSLDKEDKEKAPFDAKINIQAKIDYLTSLLCAQCSYLMSDDYSQNKNSMGRTPLLEEVRKWYVDHKKCERGKVK
jgi:hypothetical protein